MYQISSFWNNLKNKVQNLVEVQNNSNKDKRIICIQNFLLKELNLNHKGKDHQIEKLVFVRDSQLNIGSIQCQDCFQQQEQSKDYQYSLDLLKILEDVYYFIDQVSTYFQNDQQFQEEQPYHQLKIFKVMKETFDIKSINKDIIWKINTCILEIESRLYFSMENTLEYFGKIHYQNMNRVQMNRFIQNIQNQQKQINTYRSYIKLLPTIISIRKFHPQSEYIYQQTVSYQYLAILINYQIIIYNIKSEVKFSKVNVDYENNKIILFKFTQDEKYLIFAYEKPNHLIIYNMKDKIILNIQDQQPCLHMACQEYINLNYLILYNQNLTLKKCISLEYQTSNNFELINKFSFQEKQIQTFIFYDNQEKKWKSLIRNDYGSIATKKIQITKKFKLQLVQTNRMNRLYYTLISNQKKKIRKVATQDQYQLNTYILSKDETFIISSSLSFYEISTGKITFQIRLNENEELQDVQLEDDKVKILTWDNLYIYDQISQKKTNS
ncbi:unnamed protein product [Paramecium pentaurelia]|uniref:Uncharacterized protein n=1 Tax=Paramecium pentaurelia TaxID=43138 RepID=A0A8S1WYJ1_9CILI|nr:unnamed protein product [Paramecium pentaurelia]